MEIWSKNKKKNSVQNEKKLVIYLTSGFSKANLTLYSPQVLRTPRPNPAGQFIDDSNPAGQFLDVSKPAGQFFVVFFKKKNKSKKIVRLKKKFFLLHII